MKRNELDLGRQINTACSHLHVEGLKSCSYKKKSGKYISDTELAGIELKLNWKTPLREPC